VLAALILAAAALRLPGLGAASLWLDECSSIETALAVARSTSWAVMRALFRGLSAYTLLLAPWIERDVSEWAARLPSVVAGIALVPIAWLLGKEIGGRPLAWRLGAAVALSPFFVWHSREARWYPLTWLLAGIGTLYFLRALRRPAGSSLAGCLGFGLAAASTFSPAVTLLFVEIPWIAAVHRADPAVSSPAAPGARLALRLALCVLGVLGIAWLWLALLAPALRVGSHGFGFSNLGGPRVGAVLYVPVALATGYTIGPGPLEWHSRPLRLPAVPESLTMLAAVAIVTMLLVLGYREIAASRRRSRATALLTLGIVPPVMLVAASLWTDHRFAPRHVGMSFLCLLCLAAAGTLRPSGRKPLARRGAPGPPGSVACQPAHVASIPPGGRAFGRRVRLAGVRAGGSGADLRGHRPAVEALLQRGRSLGAGLLQAVPGFHRGRGSGDGACGPSPVRGAGTHPRGFRRAIASRSTGRSDRSARATSVRGR
jgi:4-amino-4-deoxy-L-arabinose transferase-like glycosyltransferase